MPKRVGPLGGDQGFCQDSRRSRPSENEEEVARITAKFWGRLLIAVLVIARSSVVVARAGARATVTKPEATYFDAHLEIEFTVLIKIALLSKATYFSNPRNLSC
jgi:hypothetical protein